MLRNSFLELKYPRYLRKLMQYAYMCHFYANPLSILFGISDVDPERVSDYLSPVHLNAIRALPSMKSFVEGKLAAEDDDEVRSILSDDSYLITLLPQFIDEIQNHAKVVRNAVVILGNLCDRTKTKRDWVDIYLGLLLGEIDLQTPFVREVLQLQR